MQDVNVQDTLNDEAKPILDEFSKALGDQFSMSVGYRFHAGHYDESEYVVHVWDKTNQIIASGRSTDLDTALRGCMVSFVGYVRDHAKF